MLPWWFWVLLWAVLVLATLLFLVLAAFKLFRGFMALAGQIGDAMDATGEAMGAEAGAQDYPVVAGRTPSGVAALFQDPDEARRAHQDGKQRRSTARRDVRVQRKTLRRQPQRVADLELF